MSAIAETPTIMSMTMQQSTTAGDWSSAFEAMEAGTAVQSAPNFDIRAELAQYQEAVGSATTTHTSKDDDMSETRRIVKVYIVDPDENVPVDKCLLHEGEQKMTEATDEELFFEIDINRLLSAHNEMRVKLVDKSVKEREEHLEPARIRDLRMTVVTIAAF